METDLEKIIKERAEKLPANVVEAIRNVPLIEKMQRIVKSNKLDKKKEGLFINETILVVLGVTSPQTYPKNLTENVGLNDDTVIKIAKEVDEQIIAPILKIVEKKEVKQVKPAFIPKTPAANLPMIEEGEKVHDVPHVEPPSAQGFGGAKQPNPPSPKAMEGQEVSLPDYRYEGGKDPYREPLK